MTIQTDTIHLDGSSYIKFPINDSFYSTSGVFLDMELDIDDWVNIPSNQIIGNYNGQGYGLFIERGIQDINTFTIFDSGNGHLLYFNQEGGIISQRNLPTSSALYSGADKPSPVNVKCFTIDHLGFRYVYDSNNNIFSKLDNNNLLVGEFFGILDTTRPKTHIISALVNSVGELFVMDKSDDYLSIPQDPIIPNDPLLAPIPQDPLPPVLTTIYKYDTTADNWVEVKTLDDPDDNLKHNSFVIHKDDTISTYFSSKDNLMLLDSKNNTYNHFGVNIYKNKIPWYYIGSGFNTFGIDLNDNIWVVYNENRIMKLNPKGELIFDKNFHQFKSCALAECPRERVSSTNMALSFTVRTYNGENESTPWIIMDATKYAIQLDSNGVVLGCFNISNLFDHTSYPSLEFDKIEYTTNGDFTGFYSNKLYTKISQAEETFILAKVMTEVNGELKVNSISYPTATMATGNHRLGMIYDAPSGFFGIYVDGALVVSDDIRGPIHYDNDIHPPVLIGATSGNTRAAKEELGLLDAKYMTGTFTNILITRNNRRLVTSNPPIHPITLEFTSVNPLSFKEEVSQLFALRPKGFKSTTHNLMVLNSGVVEDSVKEVIVGDILEMEGRVNPVQTTIKEIEWVNETELKDYPFVTNSEEWYTPPYTPTQPTPTELANSPKLVSVTNRIYYNDEVSIVMDRGTTTIKSWAVKIGGTANPVDTNNIFKYGVFANQGDDRDLRHEHLILGIGVSGDGSKIYGMVGKDMVGEFLLDLNTIGNGAYTVYIRSGVADDYEQGEPITGMVIVAIDDNNSNNKVVINTGITLPTTDIKHGVIFYNNASYWKRNSTFYLKGGTNTPVYDTPVTCFDVAGG